MAQPDKQQIGDGGDNIANAARQAQNAAAASVNAAATAGSQAVANVAAGTASGGPWGAIIMAAWSMRHTLFKILIFICLFLMFFVALIVSLPSIIFDYIMGASNQTNVGGPVVGINEAYVGLQDVVNGYVVEGHDAALRRVDQIIADNEDLFYMSVFITISATSYDELVWRKQQMVDMLKSMDMFTRDCNFQQEAALHSVMPFLSVDKNLEKKTKRNVLTSGAASTYMFTSFELSDDNGILLGVNKHNNSLCIVDLFNTKVHKNANLTITGTSGAGKT